MCYFIVAGRVFSASRKFTHKYLRAIVIKMPTHIQYVANEMCGFRSAARECKRARKTLASQEMGLRFGSYNTLILRESWIEQPTINCRAAKPFFVCTLNRWMRYSRALSLPYHIMPCHAIRLICVYGLFSRYTSFFLRCSRFVSFALIIFWVPFIEQIVGRFT